MAYETYEFKLGLEQIKIDPNKIISAMGYPSDSVPLRVSEMVDEQIYEAKHHIDLKCGFVFLPPGNIYGDGGHVYLKNQTFHTKRIVGVPLRKMQEAVLFVGTIGHMFDKWSRETFANGDPLAAYVIDMVGSEIAEGVAEWTEAKIVEIAKEKNKKCSNRYSPGYCGWHVSEQHKLFSFLPKNFCGISLTESALMKPHKSVSGIIGISEDMKYMEYPCDVCRVTHCYKNRGLKRH